MTGVKRRNRERPMTADMGVGGMSCASCAASLEAALGRVPGVTQVSVNLATERAMIAYDADVTSVKLWPRPPKMQVIRYGQRQ